MVKNQYKQYLFKKYNIDASQLNQYIKIDMMKGFLSMVPGEETYFKGAANLFFKYNYIRETLTKDLDFATKQNIKKQMDAIKVLLPSRTKLYEYSYLDSKKLEIATNGYEGFKNRRYIFNWYCCWRITERKIWAI